MLLKKILAEATLITNLITGYDCETFISDEKTKRAVCMTLINIGEMVKLLSGNLKRENTHIPWRAIAGLRDVTAHGYMTLRMEDIWETVSADIVALIVQIEKLQGNRL
ncbi:MAG: DUF86 domain-containing protein [Defluviitaleaceae bacterium]|nr:DUF86 domain-containing protein [Defluviitaleaceae bacterium]